MAAPGHRRKGFTLVELAIVLVIIGLLIGGILVARSMMETSKITSFVKEIQGYDIAIQNFKLKYNALPGDSNLYGANGNLDGIIGHTVSGGGAWGGWNNETGNAWVELGLSGFAPQSNFVYAVTNKLSHKNSGATNTPSVALSSEAAVLIATLDGLTTLPWTPNHGYIISKFDYITGTGYATGGHIGGGGVGAQPAGCGWEICGLFSQQMTKSVDLKLDDGDLGTGNMRGNLSGSANCTATIGCTTGVNCLCTIYIRPLSQVGQDY